MGNKISGIPDGLKIIGWIYLAVGIIAAIIIWITMGSISTGYARSTVNPFGIALGFASLFQSVVVCVIFQAIGLITETLLDIRNKYCDETISNEKTLEKIIKEVTKEKKSIDNLKNELARVEKGIKKVGLGFHFDLDGVWFEPGDIEGLRPVRQALLDAIAEAGSKSESESQIERTDLEVLDSLIKKIESGRGFNGVGVFKGKKYNSHNIKDLYFIRQEMTKYQSEEENE